MRETTTVYKREGRSEITQGAHKSWEKRDELGANKSWEKRDNVGCHVHKGQGKRVELGVRRITKSQPKIV